MKTLKLLGKLCIYHAFLYVINNLINAKQKIFSISNKIK